MNKSETLSSVACLRVLGKMRKEKNSGVRKYHVWHANVNEGSTRMALTLNLHIEEKFKGTFFFQNWTTNQGHV